MKVLHIIAVGCAAAALHVAAAEGAEREPVKWGQAKRTDSPTYVLSPSDAAVPAVQMPSTAAGGAVDYGQTVGARDVALSYAPYGGGRVERAFVQDGSSLGTGHHAMAAIAAYPYNVLQYWMCPRAGIDHGPRFAFSWLAGTRFDYGFKARLFESDSRRFNIGVLADAGFEIQFYVDGRLGQIARMHSRQLLLAGFRPAAGFNLFAQAGFDQGWRLRYKRGRAEATSRARYLPRAVIDVGLEWSPGEEWGLVFTVGAEFGLNGGPIIWPRGGVGVQFVL